MRNSVLFIVLTSMLMSVCIPVCSQNTESADFNQGVKFNESRDSVIINTDAFKITDVSDSAMMEKIRRLPGVEIDAEGHIYSVFPRVLHKAKYLHHFFDNLYQHK